MLSKRRARIIQASDWPYRPRQCRTVPRPHRLPSWFKVEDFGPSPLSSVPLHARALRDTLTPDPMPFCPMRGSTSQRHYQSSLLELRSFVRPALAQALVGAANAREVTGARVFIHIDSIKSVTSAYPPCRAPKTMPSCLGTRRVKRNLFEQTISTLTWATECPEALWAYRASGVNILI